MNIYDILIGIVIGIGLERALKISVAVQESIKRIKKQRKEKERKDALVKSAGEQK